MKILIAGASGFIGRALVETFQKQHTLYIIGRDAQALKKVFPGLEKTLEWNELDSLNPSDFDAIINLCGHNISASRWNPLVKQQIIDSRVQTSTTLINWLIKGNAKPHFYCANAIGIYGMQDNNDPSAFDEDSVIDYAHPRDFLTEIGTKWETALQPAIDAGIPVTTTRFGVVLKKGEGMLSKLTLAFNLGLGSVMGDGKQILSWVHIDDVVAAFSFLLANPQLTGNYNVTSPNPVSQAEFARALATAMHRPLILKTPAFVIKTMFGEMGECLILKGQRVVPKRLLAEGFQFKFKRIEEALDKEFSGK